MSSDIVLLVGFRWPVNEPGRARLNQYGEAMLGLYRAVEGGVACAYIAMADDGVTLQRSERELRAGLRGATLARLEPLADLAGASTGAVAPYRYVVATDVDPAVEADFNAWYDSEHMPGLAAVEGTVRAQRFRNPTGRPRYHACYDLTTPETLGSPSWLAVRGTEWSSRIRPAFRNTKRTMYRRV